MEEREINRHERLKQKLSELEQEWTAMKTGKKSSSPISWITVEEALEFVENSPTKLMLSLQHDEACPEADMVQKRSPTLMRKLFHDSEDDDETKTALFSHSSCWSSNVMRASDDRKKKKKIARIVSVSTVLLLSCVLIILINVFIHLSINRQINTLVPT
ncbi:Protein SINE4 [Cardamine amara subsp. amara]|uniref:Protein SINE4 n=1 Tax=Cardamine amara subsp. amara TaxID=228776 RepID=A0ABD1A2Y1_CARAN